MTQDTSSTLSDLFYVFSDGVIAKEASELWNAAKTKCNSGEYSVDAFLVGFFSPLLELDDV